jgi:exopolyphosphatase/guanosine-5'-triphosphate,3'-diphosphate pyrophosphatase
VIVAAVDCGTNSIRLLVADASVRPFRTIERLMRITRLGEGVDATGSLNASAIERTVAVLREYREVMDRLGVERVRATATSAARDAANREEFFSAAEATLGTRPELIGGDEEARLSFRGATAELEDPDEHLLVMDIGGGSTEFAVGYAGSEPEGVISFDIGCVRVTEKFLHSDPPSAVELSQAISVVHAYLDDLTREVPEAKDASRLVGLAGTVSTMAAVDIGLATYDRDRIHHYELTRDAAEDAFRTLATERRVDRAHNPGLEAARVDVIVGGAAILVTVMRHLDFDACLVSESDILDGLILSQL